MTTTDPADELERIASVTYESEHDEKILLDAARELRRLRAELSAATGRIFSTISPTGFDPRDAEIARLRAENEKLINAFIWPITGSARLRHPEYYEGAYCEAAVPGLDPETADFIVLESRFGSINEARAAIRKAAGIGGTE